VPQNKSVEGAPPVARWPHISLYPLYIYIYKGWRRKSVTLLWLQRENPMVLLRFCASELIWVTPSFCMFLLTNFAKTTLDQKRYKTIEFYRCKWNALVLYTEYGMRSRPKKLRKNIACLAKGHFWPNRAGAQYFRFSHLSSSPEQC